MWYIVAAEEVGCRGDGAARKNGKSIVHKSNGVTGPWPKFSFTSKYVPTIVMRRARGVYHSICIISFNSMEVKHYYHEFYVDSHGSNVLLP